VATVSVLLEAYALAAIALGAGTDANLVHLAGLRAGRDEPTPAGEVLNRLAVGLEEAATSPYIVGGGLVRLVRYSHCVNLLFRLAVASGGCPPRRGHFFMTPAY